MTEVIYKDQSGVQRARQEYPDTIKDRLLDAWQHNEEWSVGSITYKLRSLLIEHHPQPNGYKRITVVLG